MQHFFTYWMRVARGAFAELWRHVLDVYTPFAITCLVVSEWGRVAAGGVGVLLDDFASIGPVVGPLFAAAAILFVINLLRTPVAMDRESGDELERLRAKLDQCLSPIRARLGQARKLASQMSEEGPHKAITDAIGEFCDDAFEFIKDTGPHVLPIVNSAHDEDRSRGRPAFRTGINPQTVKIGAEYVGSISDPDFASREFVRRPDIVLAAYIVTLKKLEHEASDISVLVSVAR